MAKLDKVQISVMEILAEQGEAGTVIARRLGVSEGTVRYHLKKTGDDTPDGRLKAFLIERLGLAEVVAEWWATEADALPAGRSPNATALHEWLKEEHDYAGSVKSVRKYVRHRLGRPPLRPFRRVETPPGVQAQVDWSEHPDIDLGDGEGLRTLYVFHMVLSHCRHQVSIVCLGCDQLWWHYAHLEAFRRLGGIPAVVRIDNLKTGVAQGAGHTAVLNASYQVFARSCGFHIDTCEPYQPQQKGKVERGVRTFRQGDLRKVAGLGRDALQAWMDQRWNKRAEDRPCPATGTTIREAWEAERAVLRPLPDPCPEPFNVVVERQVSRDCLVCFEGRQYGVPFTYCKKPVEIRGCAYTVAIHDRHSGLLLISYPRHTQKTLLIDPSIYEGDGNDRVHAPTPLGSMGKRIQELAADTVERRSIDWYKELMEVAR